MYCFDRSFQIWSRNNLWMFLFENKTWLYMKYLGENSKLTNNYVHLLYFNPVTFNWHSCITPGEWAVLHICILRFSNSILELFGQSVIFYILLSASTMIFTALLYLKVDKARAKQGSVNCRGLRRFKTFLYIYG